MKAKIIDVREESGQLRVIVEHDYGSDNIGLSLGSQKINHVTGEPKWVNEVKNLLNKKYRNAKIPSKKTYVGKELDISTE